MLYYYGVSHHQMNSRQPSNLLLRNESRKETIVILQWMFIRNQGIGWPAATAGLLSEKYTVGGESARLVKDAQQSCLKPYADFCLSPSSAPISRSSRSCRRLRLVEGRHVSISLHHEEFISELNHKGQTASQDFIRRVSFGAYLYHLPVDVLSATGCAMALAIATLWREIPLTPTSASATNATPVLGPTPPLQNMNRFLDATQLCLDSWNNACIAHGKASPRPIPRPLTKVCCMWHVSSYLLLYIRRDEEQKSAGMNRNV